jgi:hypothetical protein
VEVALTAEPVPIRSGASKATADLVVPTLMFHQGKTNDTASLASIGIHSRAMGHFLDDALQAVEETRSTWEYELKTLCTLFGNLETSWMRTRLSQLLLECSCRRKWDWVPFLHFVHKASQQGNKPAVVCVRVLPLHTSMILRGMPFFGF